MTTSLTELEKFIKMVKKNAKISSSFVHFYNFTRQLNYKPFMNTAEFNRLVSVASVEANLA